MKFVILTFLAVIQVHAQAQVHDMAHMKDVENLSCETVGFSEFVSPQQQEVINSVMGAHNPRLEHALWHTMRAGIGDKDTKLVSLAFGPTWTKNHEVCPGPGGNSEAADYNPSGEDFLYMHHLMVQLLNGEMIKAKLSCIKGWKNIDEISTWAIPDQTRTGPKSESALALFLEWDRRIQDPTWLKTISLSQLGWVVEFTIHNNLHMRFAEDRPPLEFRAAAASDDGAPIPFDGKFKADWKFDNPGYNWLADPYGAAVNPIFWKIHGYVDSLIGLWLNANGKKSIASNCGDRVDCYQWRGTWTGEPIVNKNVSPPTFGGRPGTKAGGPIRFPVPLPNDPELNRKRMAHQRIGVVTDQEFLPRPGGPLRSPGKPGSSASEPVNMLEVARQRICK